ncbi:hypothetical protein ACFX5Q_07325 [Mesorhizobium sp. IMUNJ 23033]|uniref:hypothetical protein n=1 Tax=Mesorhizobium sp. IMUNJ 23033 TaxID=3378039 RepID=UPI0038504533
MGKALAALALCSMLAGCTTTAPVADPRKVWCDHNKPQRPSQAVFEVMTRPELDDMNAHNALGVKWCRWQP